MGAVADGLTQTRSGRVSRPVQRLDWTLEKRVPEMSVIPCRNVLVGFTLSFNNEKCFILNVKRVPEMSIIQCTVIHEIGNIALSSNNEKCSIFIVKRVPEMYIILCTVIHVIGNIALSSNYE
jgi:hypothetical protein